MNKQKYLNLKNKFQKGSLENGLKYICSPNSFHHKCSIVMLVRVGSRNETPKEYGLAHYLEHMLFKGNRTYPKYLQLNKKIDIICITSKFDGTPNVLGEAVSYKIPCLAPRNVGLSNMVLLNGMGGYLYKSNSSDSFKSKLSSMLLNYDKAINKSNLAYKGLERFSYNNTLLKLKKYINEI